MSNTTTSMSTFSLRVKQAQRVHKCETLTITQTTWPTADFPDVTVCSYVRHRFGFRVWNGKGYV